jgi:hypothetical protein
LVISVTSRKVGPIDDIGHIGILKITSGKSKSILTGDDPMAYWAEVAEEPISR